MDHFDLERNERENAKRRKTWDFRAFYAHDTSLEFGTWAVNGKVQTGDLTEDTLFAAIMANAPKKPLVIVGAPLHLVIGRIIGYMPPYRHTLEAGDAA